MPEYVLTYGQPRPSSDGASVIYETKRLPREHQDDEAAIRWARDAVPHDAA